MAEAARGRAEGGAVVGVVVNTVGGYSRGLLRGITSFGASRAWQLRVQGVNEGEIDPAGVCGAGALGGRPFDGLIVQASTEEVAREFSAIASSSANEPDGPRPGSRAGGGGGAGGRGDAPVTVPVVNVSSSLAETGLPTVITDDAAVGRMGAEHFLRAGYRSVAFFSPDRRAFARVRHAGFAGRCAEAGVEVRLLEDDRVLESSLRATAGPLAVMGCNDRAALAVLDRCRSLGRRVPEDVAVLGVDDDDLVQALASPPLSTVNTARDRVGFEAAEMLERLMAGQRVEATAIVRVGPKGVVARKSTDATAITDGDVAEAAKFIHTHAGRGITVEDVAKAATVSRRQLERRFRAAMGHSLLDEITRCRVERARQMLLDTELTLDQIARAAGFASASYFSVVFKRSAGTTPQRYRDAYRAGVR